MPTPHPLFGAFKAACDQRGTSMNQATALVPISSSAIHRLRCGQPLNDELTARLQAWIDGSGDAQPTDAGKAETATVRKPRAAKAKPVEKKTSPADQELVTFLRAAADLIEQGNRSTAMLLVRAMNHLVEAA